MQIQHHNHRHRNIFDLYIDVINKIGIFQTIKYLIIVLGITLIYMRVFKNFDDAKKQKNNKKREVKSIVETVSMTGFFIVIWLVVSFKLGTFNYQNIYLDIIFIIIYIIGVVFNLLGRYYLGHNWGNNVIIYKDHTLVNKGVYKIVRHPLYASIIWMIYSVGVLCQNYLVFILNTIIFIPFMYYRAKQEEKELVKEFKEYKDYRKKTGMFFPKITFKREK